MPLMGLFIITGCVNCSDGARFISNILLFVFLHESGHSKVYFLIILLEYMDILISTRALVAFRMLGTMSVRLLG